MKPLPLEGHGPRSPKNKTTAPRKTHHLAHYRVEIRKISKRLNKYADSPDLPDHEVMDLLEDTRSKVISLHLARKNQKQKPRHRGRN